MWLCGGILFSLLKFHSSWLYLHPSSWLWWWWSVLWLLARTITDIPTLWCCRSLISDVLPVTGVGWPGVRRNTATTCKYPQLLTCYMEISASIYTCSGAVQRSSFLCAGGNWMQAAEAGLLIALRWQMSPAKLLQARWQMVVVGGAPGHCRINITNRGL